MDALLSSSDGGTVVKFEPVLSEQVTGPARAGQALLYYLKGVGFRIKTFGANGEPLSEANVSVVLENQTSTPPALSDKGQIFSKTVDGVSQLFYITDTGGGSVVYQLSPPVDGSLFLKKDGSVALTGNLSAGNHKFTNVADPVDDQDAANKQFVTTADTSIIASVSAEAAARAAAVSAEAASRAAGDAANLLIAQEGLLTVTFDGDGDVLPVDMALDVYCPWAFTILGVVLLADQSGSVAFDIEKKAYASYPPGGGDSIVASAPPTISAATKSKDTTLTGWTTSVAADSTLRIKVASATTVTRVTLALNIRKT